MPHFLVLLFFSPFGLTIESIKGVGGVSGVFLAEGKMRDVEYVSQIHKTPLNSGKLSSLDLGSSHPYNLN
jgi:hypothetical protein